MLGRYFKKKKNASDGGIPWQVVDAMTSTNEYSLHEIGCREPAAKKAKVMSIAGLAVPDTSIKNNLASETTCPPVREQSVFSEDENKLVLPSNNLDQTPKKGAFSEEEDMLVLEEVERRGHKWTEIADLLLGRTPAQVSSRYENHLDPTLKKGAFSEEEDKLVLEEVERRGRKWSEIAKLLPGRTCLQVSYRYENHLDPTIVWIEASESTSTRARGCHTSAAKVKFDRDCFLRIYHDKLNVTCDCKVSVCVVRLTHLIIRVLCPC